MTAITVCVSPEAHTALWELKRKERRSLAEIATEILEGALSGREFTKTNNLNCKHPNNGCKRYVLFERMKGLG